MAIRKLTPNSPVAKTKAKTEGLALYKQYQLQQAQHQKRPPKPLQRRVTFNEQENQVYTNTQWSAWECRRLWYSSVDMSMMKERRANTVKKLVDPDKLRERRNRKDGFTTYSAILIRGYEASIEEENAVSPRDVSQLLTWVHGASDRHGLEYASSPRLRRDQRSRKFSLVCAILEAQAQAQVRARCSTSGVTISTSHLLYAQSRAYSRPARCWARHLGEALAAACLLEE
jgi:hypothetical protein